jgi:hypothetical protein
VNLDVSYHIRYASTTKATHFQSFAGLNFINDYLRRNAFEATVTTHLGHRSVLAKYSYADILCQLFFIAAINGNILKEQLKDHPDLTIASPDTIKYAFQELRRTSKQLTTGGGVCHQINEHEDFIQLLVTLCSTCLWDTTKLSITYSLWARKSLC